MTFSLYVYLLTLFNVEKKTNSNETRKATGFKSTAKLLGD